MSTHNVCFHGEIRRILCGYPLLSIAMISVQPDLDILVHQYILYPLIL